MAKKGSDQASSSRPKRGRTATRGRGGRGRGLHPKDRAMASDVRPESAVDNVSDNDGESGSEGENDVKIEVPVAMWVGCL